MRKGKTVLITRLVLLCIFILVISCFSPSLGTSSTKEQYEKFQVTKFAAATSYQLTMESRANEQNALNAQSSQGTQVAISVQGTTIALQNQQSLPQELHQEPQIQVQQNPPAVQQNPPAGQQNPGTGAQNPAAPQAGVTPSPEATSTPQMEPFDTWKTKASILLYEDMAGQYDAGRTIKDALEALSLKATRDEKDSSGFFLGDIRSGGPGGKPWDLIISGSEARTAVQGEFIPPLNEAVSQGSSLIMEQWNLDAINLGKISTLMMRCGVKLGHDITLSPHLCLEPDNESLLVLWPIDSTSPILHEPNEGLRLSSMSGYWSHWYSSSCAVGNWSGPWDYGDELELIPGSKAKVVLGRSSTNTEQHATLVSCQEGRVTLWTSSTHNYATDRVLPLWMNMIHNALKSRWEFLSKISTPAG